MTYNKDFWDALQVLINESKVIIDRKRNTAHPKFPNFIYPVDYGYLENTSSMDGDGIDIWLGSNQAMLNGIICTIDLLKKDSEIKILLNCTDEEAESIIRFHNSTDLMKGLFIAKN